MMPGKTIIIAGDRASGKTTYATQVCDWFENKGISYTAILSPGFFEGSERTYYKLLCRPGGQEYLLCQRQADQEYVKGGGFWFNPAAIRAGIDYLQKTGPSAKVVLMDEIGRLEAEGMVWAPVLHTSESWSSHRVICIRTPFIPLIMNIIRSEDLHIIDTGTDFAQMITLLQTLDIS